MTKEDKIMEKKGGILRFPSSVFFNLFALAIFLAAVIILHQVLKKPEIALEQEATQAQEVQTDTPEPEVVKVDQEKGKQAVAKDSKKKVAAIKTDSKPKKSKVVKKKTKKRRKKRYTRRKRYRPKPKKAPPGPSVEELDSEAARQKYMSDTYRLSEGLKEEGSVAPTSTRSNDSSRATTRVTTEYSVDSLDNEAVRQHYLDENKRLSRGMLKD